MSNWQDIQTDAMMRDFGKLVVRDDPLYKERAREMSLLRMRDDLNQMITESMMQSQQMPDQMEILKHLVYQNKMLKQQADMTLARLHNKKEGLRQYIQMKRSENFAYDTIANQFQKSNDRLKDMIELCACTGLKPRQMSFVTKHRESIDSGPAYGFRDSVYKNYLKAYPSKKEVSKETSLHDLVKMRQLLKQKGGDRDKKLKKKLASNELMLTKAKLRAVTQVKSSESDDDDVDVDDDDDDDDDDYDDRRIKGQNADLIAKINKMKKQKEALLKTNKPQGGKKESLDKATLAKLLSSMSQAQKKSKQSKQKRYLTPPGDTDSDDDDDVDVETTDDSEPEDLVNLEELWKKEKQKKYQKLRKLSEMTENIPGLSSKEYKKIRNRRVNSMVKDKKRNLASTYQTIDDVSKRIEALEAHSTAIMAQKDKIEKMLEQKGNEQSRGNDDLDDDDDDVLTDESNEN